MPNRRRDRRPDQDGARVLTRCPLCQAAYGPEAAQMVGAKDDAHLVHLSCAGCGNAVLALVLLSSVGVSSVGLVTDLSYEDVLRFRESAPVSADDVLAAHALTVDGAALLRRLL